MRIFILLLSFFSLALANEFVDKSQYNSVIWGAERIKNISPYYDGFAPYFVNFQAHNYFAIGALVIIIAAIVGFLGHYLIVGPKIFSHNHSKIYAFSAFERIIHLIAAISWVILVPTGVIMMFGEEFGGGLFVRICKNLHGLATIAFAIVVLPMLFVWLYRMLPKIYDIKWMMIVGGYLSKTKRPIPAGKFNAGQKAWYWVSIPGGVAMILTGASMFFLDYNLPSLREFLGLSQIEILRLSALIHNILGIACAVFFLVHIYMAVFAIKGSIYSIITGYKEEEEVYILHHYWYQELLKKGKIEKSIFEKEYENLK